MSRTEITNGNGRPKRFSRSYGHAADLKVYGRARASNGVLLPGVDQRSVWVRRAKDLIRDHLVDVGGEENASAAERSLIRRAACLTVELELLERKFATAGPASPDDLDLYQRTAGGLRRLLETVGIKRRPRDVTDDARLSDLLTRNMSEADGSDTCANAIEVEG